MALLSEEQRNTLKQAWVRTPHVNANCIGCSACVAISPDVFDLSDEGLSVVVARESYEELGVDDSIMACPVAAISWK